MSAGRNRESFAASGLLAKARALKRRRLATGLARCASLLFAAIFAGAAPWPLVIYLPEGTARLAAMAASVVVGTVLGLFLAIRRWKKLNPQISTAQAARLLGGDDLELSRLLSTGLDLADWGGEGATQRRAAQELVDAQVSEAERAANGLDSKAEASAPAVGEVKFLALSASILALALLAAPAQFKEYGKSLLGAGAPVPVSVGNLKVTIQPPAHTGLAMTMEEGGDATVRAFAGSRVILEGLLSRTPGSGELILPGARTVELMLKEESFRAEWVVRSAGPYRMRFFEEGQRVDNDFAPRDILLLEDETPGVALLEPTEDVESVTTQSIFVSYEAKDDFGIDKLELVLQGDEEVRIPLPLPHGDGDAPLRKVAGELDLLPAAYPQLGNGAYLRVDAWDNDTVGGPKTGSSNAIYITLLSLSSMRAEIEGLEKRLLEAMLEYLADHLEAPGIDGAITQEKLKRGGDDLLALLERLVDRVRKGEEEGLFGAVAVLNIEAGLKRELKRWSEEDGPSNLLIAELERDILFIDRMLRELRMEQALSLGDELAALQNDLFNRIQQGEDIQSLQKAVSRIEELLREMGKKLSSPESMPDGFANSDAVKDAPEDSLNKKLEELQKALAEGDREKAAKLAEEIMEELSQWLDKLSEAADGEMEAEMDPLSQELEELSADIQSAMVEQERILGETRRVADDATQKMVAKLKQMLDQFKKLQRERVAEISRQIVRMQNLVNRESSERTREGKAKKNPSSPHSGNMMIMEARRELSRLIQQVERELDRGIKETLEGARLLEEKVDTFDNAVAAELEKPEYREQGREHGRIALEAVRAIIKDIEELLSKRLENIDQAALDDLSKLSLDEEGLSKELEKLEQRLKKLSEESAMIDPKIAEPAKRAGKNARGAGGKLGAGDPYGSIPMEGKVLENLAELSGEMEKMRSQMEGQRPGGNRQGRMKRGREKGGRDLDRSRVEIPAETEAREWREFREEVMKAMREGRYPREYEGEVRRYYEGLIR